MANAECQNFYVGEESQVSQFIKKHQPKYSKMAPKYKTLCADLENTLQELFPGCQVHRFGSTMTGLYLTDSDVDVFVELAEKNQNFFNTSELIQKSKVLLYKYGNLFTEITAIPFARTPICKLLYKPTNIYCDFNFKSVIGIYNSRLIRYYLRLDDRLGHLMMVIKYWAKMQGLVNTSDFSNYSLAVMFIFYLQHVYELPPVADLQTDRMLNMQENWNVGVDYSVKWVPQYLSKISAEDILFGFFEYYALFNYELDIICPFLGHPVTKHDFVKFDYLKPLFKLYEINLTTNKPLDLKTEICVQDLFEHTNNLTARVKKICFKKFITLCERACNIFEQRPVSNRVLDELFEKQHLVRERPRKKNQRNNNKKFNNMVEFPVSSNAPNQSFGNNRSVHETSRKKKQKNKNKKVKTLDQINNRKMRNKQRRNMCGSYQRILDSLRRNQF